MEITNFYIPNSDQKLKLLKEPDNQFVWDKELEQLSTKWKNNPFPVGILDCAKDNKGYNDLLEQSNISHNSNNDIYSWIADKYCSAYAIDDPANIVDQQQVKPDPFPSQLVQKVIYCKMVEKWSDKSIAAVTKLRIEEIRSITNKFKVALKTSRSKEQEEKYKNERWQKERDIEDISEAVEILRGKKFGVSTIRDYVNKKRDGGDKVSFYRVRGVMKNELGLTYKRANITNKVMMQPERQRKFFESSMLQLYLEEEKAELIFIDEASWNFRN